jgi:subtilisin family serine protease
MVHSRRTALVLSSVIALILSTTVSVTAEAASTEKPTTDLLIKVESTKAVGFVNQMARLTGAGTEVKTVTNTLRDGGRWVSLKSNSKSHLLSRKALQAMPGVLAVQPNYEIRQIGDYRIKDAGIRERFANFLKDRGFLGGFDGIENIIGGIIGGSSKNDNPAIPPEKTPGTGPDTLFGEQWGMTDNNVTSGWNGAQGDGIVVAVLDSGVDYTHEDLVDNMWRNPGETGLDENGQDKATNGIDDDGNGYIDDVVGWDFVSNDNKPYDLSVSPLELLFGGGNPGHGTHCAGNIAARGENGTGVAGVAPKAKIMALRFLSEKGSGDTAGALGAIQYSITMGVKVSSNSWGSIGEDPEDPAGNQALRDIIEEARLAGQLFIAAAGNGDAQGRGYDNDTSATPAFPASYPHENIISVAALDRSDALGSFSNWGAETVDLGAPGVAVFSTTVDSKYSDKVIDFPDFGLTITWDGTSMATPHVAGAAALYWADHPNATMEEVRDAILNSAKPIPALNGKATTNGKLSVEELMR